MKRRSIYKRLSAYFSFALLTTLTGYGFWLFTTASGLQWVLSQVQRLAPVSISASGVRGGLSNGADIQELTISNSTLNLTCKQCRLRMLPGSLLLGRLNFYYLKAQDISLSISSNSAKTADESSTTTFSGFPMIVLVKEVDITSMVYRQDNTVVPLNDIKADEIRISKQAKIDNLSVVTAYGPLSFSGQVNLQRHFPLQINVKGQSTLSDMPEPLLWQLDANGDLRDVTIKAALEEPAHIIINGHIKQLIDHPNVNLTLNTERIDLVKLQPDWPIELRNVSSEISGDVDNFQLRLSTMLNNAESGQWKLNLAAQKKPGSWHVGTLQLNSETTGAQLKLTTDWQADYVFTMQDKFTLQVQWQDLQWPLNTKDAVLNTAHGSANISGSLANYQIDSNGALRYDKHIFKNLRFAAQGNLDKLQFTNIDTSYLDGDVNGNGMLEWKERLNWRAKLTGTGLDPSVIWPEFSGNLTATVEHQGSVGDQHYAIDTHVVSLQGMLKNYRITASGRIDLNEQGYTIKDLSAVSQATRLTGALAYRYGDDTTQPRVDAHWLVNSKNIAQLLPDLKGSLYSKGQATGALSTLSLQTDITARDVKYQHTGIKKVHSNISLYLSDSAKSAIDITAQDILLAGNPIQKVNIRADGYSHQHSINVDISDADKKMASLVISGNYKENRWLGKVLRSKLSTVNTGNWRQVSTSDISADAQNFIVSGYCLASQQPESELCLKVRGINYTNWAGDLNVANFPLQMVNKWFPLPVDISAGKLSGEVALKYHDSKFFAESELRSEHGAISLITDGTNPEKFSYQRLVLHLTHNTEGLHTDIDVSIAGGGTIQTVIALPEWQINKPLSDTQAIQGRLTMKLDDLTPLLAFIPDIQEPHARWDGEINLSGTLNKPNITGHSNITIDRAKIPVMGMEIQQAQLQANSLPNNAIALTGSANSGSGAIKFDGRISDIRADALSGTLQLSGQNFTAVNLPEANITVSPNLTLTLNQDMAEINGEIKIPEAALQIFEQGPTLSPSPDAVIVDTQSEQASQSTFAARSDIRIILGDHVTFTGYGATGRLEGSINVHEAPGSLTTATGELKILEGKFNAYNVELDITEGKLVYTGGSIDNPHVTIRALRKTSDETEVGVLVSGSASAPKLSLFSNPSMEDSEILSHIITGVPLSQATAEQGSNVTQAAVSLGLQTVSKDLAKKFGLDEVSVESSSATQDTSVVLGKYLSPKLYVRYAVGLGETVNTLKIQYKLADRLLIKTESGINKSADLFYTFEKD